VRNNAFLVLYRKGMMTLKYLFAAGKISLVMIIHSTGMYDYKQTVHSRF